MPFNIKVSNLDNDVFWEKELAIDEYEQVKNYIQGKSTVSLISATFKPVRTNNLKNFSKDFFLPTTINHAFKVQHAVGKIFATLASLVLDALTFPIRLFTAIPRVISNAKQKENQLHTYLIKEGVDKKLLASDYVRVRLQWEENTGKSTQYHWLEQNTHFIEVPTYKGSRYFHAGRHEQNKTNKVNLVNLLAEIPNIPNN